MLGRKPAGSARRDVSGGKVQGSKASGTTVAQNRMGGNMSTRNMMNAKLALLNVKKGTNRPSNASKSPTAAAIPGSIYSTQNTKSKRDIGQPQKVVNIDLAKQTSVPISFQQALGYATQGIKSEASLLKHRGLDNAAQR